MTIDANTIVTVVGLILTAVALWFSQRADRRAAQNDLKAFIDERVKANKELVDSQIRAVVTNFDTWRHTYEGHSRELFAKTGDVNRIEAKIDYMMLGLDELKNRVERDLRDLEHRVEGRRHGVQAADS